MIIYRIATRRKRKTITDFCIPELITFSNTIRKGCSNSDILLLIRIRNCECSRYEIQHDYYVILSFIIHIIKL